MNLYDLAQYICTKGQMTGTGDVAAAKLFLAKRYELIWNSYLWKDSLVMVNVTVTPDDPDNAEGIVLMPEIIERVVAIRSGDRSVKVTGLETFYREDFDKFAQQGTPYEFAILSPVWFVWRGYEGLTLTLGETSSGQQAKVIWRDGGGVRHTDTLSTGGQLLSPNPALSRDILVFGAGLPAVNGTWSMTGIVNGRPVFTMAAHPFHPMYWDVASAQWQIHSPDAGGFAYYSSDDVATPDLATTWEVYAPHGAPLPVPTLTTFAPAITRIEVEAVFKPDTTSLELNPNITDDAAGADLTATATRSPSYQRVRLFYIPKIETALNILGKRKCGSLTFDQEEPEIRNIDNCLIAFALGDLWARRRQMAKANQFYQEGTTLLKELAALETMQAAHNSRFIPDGGAGDPFFGPGRSSGFWI